MRRTSSPAGVRKDFRNVQPIPDKKRWILPDNIKRRLSHMAPRRLSYDQRPRRLWIAFAARRDESNMLAFPEKIQRILQSVNDKVRLVLHGLTERFFVFCQRLMSVLAPSVSDGQIPPSILVCLEFFLGKPTLNLGSSPVAFNDPDWRL